MEDILASIRRILNEEETPAADATDASPAEDEVLVLDQSMMVSIAEPEPGEPDPAAESAPPAAEAEPPAEQAEPPAAKPEPPAQQMVAVNSSVQADAREAPASDLMAPETVAAATSSIGSLVRTLTAGRATQVYAGGPTLEDMVRAELRPLLKEWLDANLPPIVERLVRTEIERVVGRAVP